MDSRSYFFVPLKRPIGLFDGARSAGDSRPRAESRSSDRRRSNSPRFVVCSDDGLLLNRNGPVLVLVAATVLLVASHAAWTTSAAALTAALSWAQNASATACGIPAVPAGRPDDLYGRKRTIAAGPPMTLLFWPIDAHSVLVEADARLEHLVVASGRERHARAEAETGHS